MVLCASKYMEILNKSERVYVKDVLSILLCPELFSIRRLTVERFYGILKVNYSTLFERRVRQNIYANFRRVCNRLA